MYNATNKLAEQLKVSFVNEGLTAQVAEKYAAEATCQSILEKTTQGKVATVFLASDCQTISKKTSIYLKVRAETGPQQVAHIHRERNNFLKTVFFVKA